MVQSEAAERGKKEVARLRAEQKARDLRRRVMLIAGVAIGTLGIIAIVWMILASEGDRVAAVEQAATQPIEGVTETPDLAADHVELVPEPTPAEAGGTVLPPTGGDHDPVWQNCGVYTEPVTTAMAVHSLEHGAVWITYRPGLDQQQLDMLTDLAQDFDYTLLSPMADLAAPVVLTAWGIQLEVDDASDPRVETFLVKYVQGEQTPEPGALCSSGFGDPA